MEIDKKETERILDVVDDKIERRKKSSGYDIDFHYRNATTSADHEEFRRMFGYNPF